MDQDATWYGGRPRPKRHCVRLGASSPTEGAQQPPTFLPMSIAAKGSPISATAELLLNQPPISVLNFRLAGSLKIEPVVITEAG